MLHIGDVEVIRIEEMLALEPAPVAEWRADLLDADHWRVPICFDRKAGAFVVSIHSWLARTRFEHGA